MYQSSSTTTLSSANAISRVKSSSDSVAVLELWSRLSEGANTLMLGGNGISQLPLQSFGTLLHTTNDGPDRDARNSAGLTYATVIFRCVVAATRSVLQVDK